MFIFYINFIKNLPKSQKIHKIRHHSHNVNRLKNERKQSSTIETKSNRDTNKKRSSLFRSNHLENSDPNVTTDSNDFHQLNKLLGLANVALEIRDTLKND
jgi:hypothetical protein